MIGGESSYDILYQADPDFQKLFKVHAEFDSSMPMDAVGYPRLRGLREPGLPRRGPPRPGLERPGRGDRAGRAPRRVPEPALHALRRDRRSPARVGLSRPHRRAPPRSGAAEVREAVEARARLANLPEEKIEDMIATGEIILQASGNAVGQGQRPRGPRSRLLRLRPARRHLGPGEPRARAG